MTPPFPSSSEYPPETSDDSFENQEKSPVLNILEKVEREKNNIINGVGNVGYLKSISIWEDLRQECAGVLSKTDNAQERQEAQQKLTELEGFEMIAFTEKISKTLQQSSWTESQEIYTDLLQKLDISTLQESAKQQLFAHLNQNLETTHYNIEEKKFTAEQETAEKNILLKSSYKKSLPEWKKMISEYENQLQTTPLLKYKEKYSQKISELKANQFLAESYTTLKETKKDKNSTWEKSVEIYKKLKADTDKNHHLSSEKRATEKKELLEEISDAIKISEINTDLKKNNFYLLEREEKLMNSGYRASKNGWKKTGTEYKNLLRRKDLPEKYREIFEKKAKEMESNFQIALEHEKLENIKEGGDSWEVSEKKYKNILRETQKNKKIPKSEKHDILAKGEEYLEIAETNVVIKELKIETEEKISDAEKNLSWEKSGNIHEDLEKKVQKTLSQVDKSLLSENNTRDISEISGTISENIKICMQEKEQEKSENTIFNAETVKNLAAENPKLAYLQKIFLAVQWQKKNISDIDIPSTPLGEQEIPDTEISAEQIQEQKIQEMQTAPDQRKTHTIDISSTGIKAADTEQAMTDLNNSVKNSAEISLVNAETGVRLNSKDSQEEAFAKAMLETLPPEISGNFRTAEIEEYLRQKSQAEIMKSHILD